MSRRCLICANINPCRQHSEIEQDRELTRNTAEFYRIAAERRSRALITPTAGNGENNASGGADAQPALVNEAPAGLHPTGFDQAQGGGE